MCTVSILRDSDGLTLTMNRDESKQRAPEVPPALVTESEGAHILAPRDSQAGGTWIGVNDHGVAACLLNVYGPDVTLHPTTPPGKRSRGVIILECLAKGDWSSCARWAREELVPEQFEPCMLAIVSVDAGALFTITSSTEVIESRLDGEVEILTSSAWNTESVMQWRRERFDSWRSDGGARTDGLPTFHISREGEAGYSVLMDRDWSCTRSVTQVTINDHAMRGTMRYWPVTDQSPAASPAESALTLSGAASS